MHDPSKGHWQAVRWILRYLQNTLDVGLAFEQDESLGQCIVEYCDYDYAGDLDKRRSTTGYLFTLAKAPVSWKSTLAVYGGFVYDRGKVYGDYRGCEGSNLASWVA